MSARFHNRARELRLQNRGDRGEDHRDSIGFSLCSLPRPMPQLPYTDTPVAEEPKPRLSRVQVRFSGIEFEFYRATGEVSYQITSGVTQVAYCGEGKSHRVPRAVAYAVIGNSAATEAFLRFCEKNPGIWHDAPFNRNRAMTAQERWNQKYSRIVQ